MYKLSCVADAIDRLQLLILHDRVSEPSDFRSNHHRVSFSFLGAKQLMWVERKKTPVHYHHCNLASFVILSREYVGSRISFIFPVFGNN